MVWIIVGLLFFLAAAAGTTIQMNRLSKLKIGAVKRTWLDMWWRR
jgi:hypothetical protein